MPKLQWDAPEKRFYEHGVDHGVLYLLATNGQNYEKGVAWNGLTAVTESPEGAEVTPLYADNIKYFNLMSAEDFKATIEAYYYPDEFALCEGCMEPVPGLQVTGQERRTFGFCYRTRLGSAVNAQLGYKIHIIYGCLAAVSERANETINDSPEARTLSWEVSTTPVEVTGYKPMAHLVIDSTKVSAEALARLEAVLYGDTESDARLPMPDEIISIISGSTHEKLAAPVLAGNDTDGQLTITVESNSAATSFDIYEGTAFVANVAKSGATTTVAYATLGYATAGSHTVKAVAQAAGYLNSDESNAVTLVVAEG